MSRKVIPLSSLVVMIGPSGAGKSTLCTQHFDPTEIVSADAIRRELLGDARRQDHQNDIFDEYYRRIEWRLSRGFRVVADSTHIRDKDRLRVASIGKKYGVPTIYMVANRSLAAKMNHNNAGWRSDVKTIKGASLIEMHEDAFVANEKKILSGDQGNQRVKVSLVIDTRVDQFTVVNKMTRKNPKLFLQQLLQRGFNRVRFVGDVHGNIDGLFEAIRVDRPSGHASSLPGTYIQFLGDIPDYGSESLRASSVVAKMVAEGVAGNLQGNHEAKVVKFIKKERDKLNHLDVFGDVNPDHPGFTGNVSHGNAVTFNQIKAMYDPARLQFETEFLGLVENSPDFIIIEANNGSFGLVHGAMRPRLFDMDVFRLPPETSDWMLAMFGQTVPNETVIGHDGNTYPKRIYDWVNDLPARHTVIVGHDVISREHPVTKTADTGGKAIFLDTGSSKDGILSWLDMEIVEKKGKLDLIDLGYGSYRG